MIVGGERIGGESMSTIRLSAKAGADCVLRLDVPVGEPGVFDVVVQVAPVDPDTTREPTPEALGWSPEFVRDVMGSIDDETFVRPPQPTYETVLSLDLDG
jgi:hypothetical protein